MRKLFYISMVIALTFSFGCTPEQEPEDVPEPPKAPRQQPESARDIVEGYGEGLTSSMDKARGAQAGVDIREVQRAVQEYALANDGAYPPSLADAKGYLSGEVDLGAFDYDPGSGAVSIKGR